MSQSNSSSLSIDKAIEVSDRVTLQDIHLVGCKSELLSFPTEKDNVHEVTGRAIVNVDKDNNTIFVVTHFNLHTANNLGEELARLEADFLLVYDATSLEGFGTAHFNEFASYNGTFNAWPYWREFVNNMASRMQLPPLTLQAYRFGETLPTESILLQKIIKTETKTLKKAGHPKSISKKVTKKKNTTKKTVKKKAKKKTKPSN